ncbi:MAG: hypothetical protein Q8R12_01995, partial [bacterium]|nr:hypothetical protein [bacterium]
MNQETRNCQNCKNEFVIEPEDFKFYEKIKVPPPTWCPECRLLRRLMFRNELNLKRRKCDLCQKEIISMYGKDVSFPVYCRECWYSDKWEPLVYGRDYAFSKPFLPQYAELQKQVPRLGLVNTNNINSEWCNNAINNKNCYLSASIAECENVAYSIRNIINSKDCLDLIFSKDSELCYDLLYSEKLYKCFFATDCRSLVDSVLIESCRNCQNCFGCINLRNKSNYIFNEQYSREDYQARIKDFDFGSYENLERIKNLFSEKSLGHIRRSNTTEKSVNVIGDQIYNSKNCKYCFQTHDSEDSKFIFVGNNVKDSYDLIHAYTEGSIELCHEVQSMVDGMRITFSFACLYSHDIQYSDHCMSSQNIFGSISLRNKSYCILNKQYTKEEYEKLVPRIIEHMNQMPYIDKKGRIYKYGEFFPPELSPFSYNETIAQEYFPLTKEQAIEQGYSWKDPEP